MTIAERAKKIENAPQDLFEMFPRYELYHGIDLEDSGETLRLFFVGDEGWDEDCGGCYCVDAYDKTGTRYCITYTVPELGRDEDEGEAEFCACQEVDKKVNSQNKNGTETILHDILHKAIKTPQNTTKQQQHTTSKKPENQEKIPYLLAFLILVFNILDSIT